MNKLKVIHSTTVWLPETQNWMFNQIQFMPPDQVENHIVCYRKENINIFNSPNIHALNDLSTIPKIFFKTIRKLNLRQFSFLRNVAVNINAQIVHSHFGHIGWSDLAVTQKLRIPHAVTFYGFDVNMLPKQQPRWKKLYNELFSQADLFLCEGPHMARCLVAQGCPQEKVKVQHLGIDLDNFPLHCRVWSKNEPLKVLIAASFLEKKGIPYALESLARIQNKVNLKITIIGEAYQEPRSQKEKTKIINTAQHTGLMNKINFLGFQPHSVLQKAQKENHIFMSPSVTATDGDTEGGAPVTLIEMMASGIPIVSSNHCDIPNLIKNGESGLLADERNVDQLAHHLDFLIENPHKWDEITKSARIRVENEFNASIQSLKLIEYYKTLLQDYPEINIS